MNMHQNARLTPLGRERMVRMMLRGHTPESATRAFDRGSRQDDVLNRVVG